MQLAGFQLALLVFRDAHVAGDLQNFVCEELKKFCLFENALPHSISICSYFQSLSLFLVCLYSCLDCKWIINLFIRSKTNDLKSLQQQLFYQGPQDSFHQCWSVTNFRTAPNLCHTK